MSSGNAAWISESRVVSDNEGEVGQGWPAVHPGLPGWESVSNHNATSARPAIMTIRLITRRIRDVRRTREPTGALIAVSHRTRGPFMKVTRPQQFARPS